VRCAASGEAWVSASDHSDTARNGWWFQLRSGLHPNKRLQAAWNAHGEAAFEYPVLETFEEHVSPLLLKDLSRAAETAGAGVERVAHVLACCGALRLAGFPPWAEDHGSTRA